VSTPDSAIVILSMLWMPLPVDCRSGARDPRADRAMHALDTAESLESLFCRQAFKMNFFSIFSTSMNDGKVGEMVVATLSSVMGGGNPICSPNHWFKWSVARALGCFLLF